MVRRSYFIFALLLIAAFTLTACSRGAQADETADTASSAPQVSESKTAAAGPAMAPHVSPNAEPLADASESVSAESASTETTSDDAATAAQDATAADLRHLPDRLVIDKLAMDIPVEEIGWSMRPGADGSVYSQWDEADYAAGWHKNSAVPGENGNVVLSGHNNIMGAVFRELDQLSRGDIATLYVNGVAHEYAVERILIVPETDATPEQRKANAAYIQPTEGEQVTLVSCWPRDNNTHRIIVIATPVPH